jgi:branched-chain amino acid transport system substrate-binding protein
MTTAGPQAILIAAPARDFLKLRALAKGAGLEGPLLYAGPEGEQAALGDDPGPSPRTYLSTVYVPESDTPANAAFVKKYQEHYHERPDLAAAMAYDGLRLLSNVLRRAPVFDPAEVRRELTRTEKFDALTGPITFGKDLHAQRPLYILSTEGGPFRLVRSYDSDEK